MLVVPVKVLVPERVRVPLPDFTKPPVPLRIPAKVEEFAPVVRMPLPRVTVPEPETEAMAVLLLAKAKIAPVAMLTSVLAERRLRPPSERVPKLIAVAPV